MMPTLWAKYILYKILVSDSIAEKGFLSIDSVLSIY